MGVPLRPVSGRAIVINSNTARVAQRSQRSAQSKTGRFPAGQGV